MNKATTVDDKPVTRREAAPVEPAERTEDRPRFIPRADIFEGRDGLVLILDMPGVDEKQVSVHLENGVLAITGRVEPENLGDRPPLLQEYQVGDFHRSFTLSEEVDPKGIEAELKDGVLRIHLPKVEEVRPRRIPVKAG
jgi:HSP20 family protein